MGRTSQKKLQIEQRRTQVADLYAKGCKQAEIARELGVSQATISSDLKAIRKELTELRVHNTDEALAERRKKLEVMSRDAWDEWERSKEPVETIRVIQKNGERRVEKTIRQQSGNPQFMRVLLQIDEKLSRLLGLDEAAGAAIERRDEQESRDKAMAMFWDLMANPPSEDTYDDPIERAIAEMEKSGTDASVETESSEECADGDTS